MREHANIGSASARKFRRLHNAAHVPVNTLCSQYLLLPTPVCAVRFGRRGGSARGRAIALVGAVDTNDTSLASEAATQPDTAAQPDTDIAAAAAADKQKRIKISFDGYVSPES